MYYLNLNVKARTIFDISDQNGHLLTLKLLNGKKTERTENPCLTDQPWL